MINSKQLLKNISIYQLSYPNEREKCLSFIELINSKNTDALSRDNYQPGHITASSFVLTPDLKNIILIYHKTLKLWLQPGGHVENDDLNIEQACKRELKEETNLKKTNKTIGLVDLDIHTIPKKKNIPEHLHFDMRFLFITDKQELQAGSDVSKAKWVSVAKLTPKNTEQSILRVLEKAPKLLKKIS